MKIIFDKDGQSYSDFSCESEVINCYKTGVNIHTSTENILYAVRVLVVEGYIPRDNVEFIIEGREVQIQKKGEIGMYTSYFEECLDRLLKAKCGF